MNAIDLSSDATAALFDMSPDVIYLNTAAAGPRLRCVNEAAMQALQDSARPWEGPAHAWRDQTEALRRLAATLLHTDADLLAFTPSVSYGMALAARSIPLRRGDNIVVLAREYPSNRMVWQLQAERVQAELREADPLPEENWTAAVLEQIDARSAVVCVPHCHWADGTLLDLAAISRAAKAAEATLIIDASQSLGALPLDLAAIDADFVICPGHKWLLGAYGLGWLWVAARWHARIEPLEHSIQSREALGDFTTLGTVIPAYRAGARRFDFGAYPHPLSVPMASAALLQMQRWGGIENIARRLAALTQHLEQALQQRALNDFLVRDHAPHICAWAPPPESLPRIQTALERAGIVLSVRGQGLRIAPHLHVSQAQLDKFAGVLAAAV